MATLEQKIWFAGFYEGEGCICNDKSNNNRMVLSISQNDPTPLYLAKKLWGGNVRQRIRKSPASDKICYGHEWKISHNKVLAFLEDTRKYMIIPKKIEQIEKALDKSKKGHKEKYKCNYCDNFYSNPSGRRRHELNNHICAEKKYICEICEKKYNSKGSLERHKKEGHSNKFYVCDLCDKVLKTKGNLNKHKKEQHVEKNIFYDCIICDKKLKTKDTLRRHKKTKSHISRENIGKK